MSFQPVLSLVTKICNCGKNFKKVTLNFQICHKKFDSETSKLPPLKTKRQIFDFTKLIVSHLMAIVALCWSLSIFIKFIKADLKDGIGFDFWLKILITGCGVCCLLSNIYLQESYISIWTIKYGIFP